MHFGCIFDDHQPMLLRQVQQGVHHHGMAVNVHRHDRPRPGRDLGLDLGNIHAPGAGVTVYEHRHAAIIDNRQCTRDDSKSRHDYFIAWVKLQASNSNL